MANESLNFDVLIIGGGPAGMSAALWCAELKLSCCLIDAGAVFGGQLHKIYNEIRNYPGADFDGGAECAKRFRHSLEGHPIENCPNTSVTAIDPSVMKVSTEEGRSLSGRAIVIATGVRRRTLGVSGESEFKGKGILDSGARDPEQVRGHRVAVVGGGDAALENASILSDQAERVFLIHRRDRFAAREEFVSAVNAKANVELILNSTVAQFGGDEELSFVDLRDHSGTIDRLNVSRAIVRIGFQPNSELVRGVVDLDEEGYITVDALGKTSSNGIHAAGDVACKVSPTISSAVGSAATAVKAIHQMIRQPE